MEWFIVGIVCGFWLSKQFRKLQEVGIKGLLAGVQVSSPVAVDVQKEVPKKAPRIPADVFGSCDFCGGDDITLAGTKHIIPCPSCKRNSRKAAKAK